jgi:hypothetical protein
MQAADLWPVFHIVYHSKGPGGQKKAMLAVNASFLLGFNPSFLTLAFRSQLSVLSGVPLRYGRAAFHGLPRKAPAFAVTCRAPICRRILPPPCGEGQGWGSCGWVRSETSETLEYLSLRERSDRQVRVRGYRSIRRGRTPSPSLRSTSLHASRVFPTCARGADLGNTRDPGRGGVVAAVMYPE